jgi:hypothetical protein
VSSLFAAFLGVNPVAHVLGPTGALAKLQPASRNAVTGNHFFDH